MLDALKPLARFLVADGWAGGRWVIGDDEVPAGLVADQGKVKITYDLRNVNAPLDSAFLHDIAFHKIAHDPELKELGFEYRVVSPTGELLASEPKGQTGPNGEQEWTDYYKELYAKEAKIELIVPDTYEAVAAMKNFHHGKVYGAMQTSLQSTIDRSKKVFVNQLGEQSGNAAFDKLMKEFGIQQEKQAVRT